MASKILSEFQETNYTEESSNLSKLNRIDCWTRIWKKYHSGPSYEYSSHFVKGIKKNIVAPFATMQSLLKLLTFVFTDRRNYVNATQKSW